MNIFTDNPVFQREARWGRRLRRLRRNKAVAWPVGLMLLCLVCFYWRGLLAFLNGANVENAGNVWYVSLWMVLGMIVLLAPTLSANAISQEREQQTWETLASTRLTAGQVVVGKWLARLVPVGLFILLALPPLLGCGYISDVSWITEGALMVFFVLNASLFGLIGLTCSFLSRSTMTAVTLSIGVSVLLCLGTYILDVLFTSLLRSEWEGDFLMCGNPFYALVALMRWLDPNGAGVPPYAPEIVVTYGIMSLVTIIVCFYYMLTRYRRTVRGGRPLGEPLK